MRAWKKWSDKRSEGRIQEETRREPTMKPCWRVVKSGSYWKVEMKITEKVRATLMTSKNETPVWDDKEQAQVMADVLNRR